MSNGLYASLADIKLLQRIHNRYFHESLSNEEAQEIIEELRMRKLVYDVHEAVLEMDDSWLAGFHTFVQEMMESQKNGWKEDGNPDRDLVRDPELREAVLKSFENTRIESQKALEKLTEMRCRDLITEEEFLNQRKKLRDELEHAEARIKSILDAMGGATTDL